MRELIVDSFAGGGDSLFDPMRSVTTRDRLGLVTIAAANYCGVVVEGAA